MYLGEFGGRIGTENCTGSKLDWLCLQQRTSKMEVVASFQQSDGVSR
jgi:hypothetical protein